MDVLGIIAAVLISGLILLFPMFLLYSGIKWLWETYVEPRGVLISSGKARSVRVDQYSIHLILNQKFRYYQKLNASEQGRFMKRTTRFILQKDFKGMNMDLTEEMVVLIAASAIQLTFGLEEYLLDHFSRIFVYPREFSSRAGKKMHKGETNLAGAIVLSWKHFKEGYDNPDDNVNLGLHEMAHALKFDKLRSTDPDKSFAEYLDKWLMISKEEFIRLRNRESAALREYGASNSSEFFSVCVEYFFESPDAFRKDLPEVYKHMCILLNQDPAAGVTQYGSTVSAEPERSVETETPIFECKSRMGGIRGSIGNFVIFAAFIIYSMTRNIADGFQASWSFWFFMIIIVSFTTYHLLIMKTRMIFYPHGIALRSAISGKLDGVVSYDDIASVKFARKTERNDENDHVTVVSMKRGRIKKRAHAFVFRNNVDVQRAAELLNEKKIPVKIKGYSVVSPNTPIYRN